jgi:hypothetical protein
VCVQCSCFLRILISWLFFLLCPWIDTNRIAALLLSSSFLRVRYQSWCCAVSESSFLSLFFLLCTWIDTNRGAVPSQSPHFFTLLPSWHIYFLLCTWMMPIVALLSEPLVAAHHRQCRRDGGVGPCRLTTVRLRASSQSAHNAREEDCGAHAWQ